MSDSGGARPPAPRVLLVDGDAAMTRVVQRELRSFGVLCARSVARALRILEAEAAVRVVISGYRLSDGTARMLFTVARRRWPHVRRVLYAESAAGWKRSAWPPGLIDEVATDFAALRRAARIRTTTIG